MLEKADLLGGTSAVSGGVMWMPNHHLMGAEYPDSAEAALAYLTAATGGKVPRDTLRWYIDTAGEAVRWLDRDTRVRLAALPRPDYHTDWPGAARGRGLDNLPFDGTEFPGLTARIRPPTYFPSITMTERDAMAASGIDAELVARRDAEGTRTMGGALIAALVASAEERGIGIQAGFGVDDLQRDGDGWVLSGTAGTVTARAVVLATGGFEWNPRLQEAFLPNPVTPISAPSNTGDGLELGLAAGGAVTAMRAVWGVPVLQDPAHIYDGRPSGPDGERGTHPARVDHGERRRPAVRQRGGQLSRPEQGVPGDRPEHRRVRQHPGLAGGRQWLPFKVFHRRHAGRSGAVVGGQRRHGGGVGAGLRDRPVRP